MNIDVLLINPQDDTAVKNGLGLVVPPLNLLYLAANLKKHSINVKIIDNDLYQLDFKNLIKLVSKMGPLIVGITATTSTINNALSYIKQIKIALPNVLTVIGGSHSTFLPVETLKMEKTLDVVVVGEGEETLKEIAENYIKNENFENFENIRGITYRDNDKIISTNIRPVINDLNSLPFPARELIPFKSYDLSSSQSGSMITTRGCVFSCSYCSSSRIMGRKFRTRDPENVVDEIEELLYRYKLKDIAFLDDIFMLDKKRAELISKEIIDRNLDINFIASSRVDTVEKNLLNILKKSGLKTLYCGVESGSQRILNLMKKNITLKQARDAFKTVKKAEIDIIASFIIGYPGETSKEMDETINFSIDLNPDYCQYSILTPFPGTPIYSKLKQKDLIATENWVDYTVLNSVINYEKFGLSKKLVEKKLAKAYLKFYTRPKYIISHSNMFKVLLKTVFRTYIEPNFRKKNPSKWYDILKNE